jgi:hypothetical protein
MESLSSYYEEYGNLKYTVLEENVEKVKEMIRNKLEVDMDDFSSIENKSEIEKHRVLRINGVIQGMDPTKEEEFNYKRSSIEAPVGSYKDFVRILEYLAESLDRKNPPKTQDRDTPSGSSTE